LENSQIEEPEPFEMYDRRAEEQADEEADAAFEAYRAECEAGEQHERFWLADADATETRPRPAGGATPAERSKVA